MKKYHESWCRKTIGWDDAGSGPECNCIEYEDGYRSTQMRLEEVETADEALAYALQTHLCYSNIMPTDLAFRVLKERLESTEYRISHNWK